MIAHRITRTSGKNSFGRLGCYVLDLNSPTDPKAFERLAAYVVDRDGQPNGERVIGARITNCEFGDDLEDAIREIEGVQARNHRSRMDKSYHLVVSFPEGEHPSAEQLRDIEDHLVASIGLGEHQRISAVHDDTDNLHVHVAINKIHPRTYRAIEPHFDKRKLMEACHELELKHGLALDNHGLADDRDGPRRSDHTVKMEVHGGRQSLAAWIDAHARDQLIEAATAAHTWSAFHDRLHDLGLTLKPRGAGFVIGALGTGAHVKASSVDRALSLKMLTGRLGEYERPPVSPNRPEPSLRYEAGPVQDTRKSGALYKRFQMERERAVAAREKALADLSQAHAAYAHKLAAHYRIERRRVAQTTYIAPALRKKLLDQLAVAHTKARTERRDLARRQRAEVRQNHPVPNWLGFLEREAARGGEQALAMLRDRASPGSRLGADALTAAERADAGHVIYQQLIPRVGKNGDVIYELKDGGRVTDRASEVRADRLSPGSAFLALSLATDRYGSQPLVVTGSAAFKAAVLEVVVERGVEVTFSDPEMERTKIAKTRVERLRDDITPHGSPVRDRRTGVAVQRGLQR
ncbi:MAG: TraI/MobA(P) family conjugative relaxase [Brevundimonas sp.]